MSGTRLGTLYTKPVASEVEMGDDVDPVSPDTRFLLWTRTHRDVAVLVAAPSERVGSQVLAEYAIAWGRMR